VSCLPPGKKSLRREGKQEAILDKEGFRATNSSMLLKRSKSRAMAEKPGLASLTL